MDANIPSVVIGALATGVIGFIVTRASKGHDARGQAEAALIGVGPQFLQQTYARIAVLETRMDVVMAREEECQRQLRVASARIESLENKTSRLPDEEC